MYKIFELDKRLGYRHSCQPSDEGGVIVKYILDVDYTSGVFDNYVLKGLLPIEYENINIDDLSIDNLSGIFLQKYCFQANIIYADRMLTLSNSIKTITKTIELVLVYASNGALVMHSFNKVLIYTNKPDPSKHSIPVVIYTAQPSEVEKFTSCIINDEPFVASNVINSRYINNGIFSELPVFDVIRNQLYQYTLDPEFKP